MKTILGTSIDTAVRLLQAGEVVAIPTETVYGLAGNALNPMAAARIFAVKERPAFDPLIVHVGAPEAVFRYARDVPEAARRLMDAFWPGPLTIVLPKREVIPGIVTSGLPTAAFRMPRHPLTLQLLRQLDFPLAAPSANLFGRLSPTRPEHVLDQLGGRIPYILDGGPATVGVESTIVQVSEDGARLWILRPGGIPPEQLETATGLPTTPAPAGPIQSPGQLERHYAPTRPLHLVDSLEAWAAQHPPDTHTAFIAFQRAPFAHPHLYILSPEGKLDEAAARLFDILHQLENTPGIRRIVAERVPNRGLGIAVNDRLRRASRR